MVALKCVLCRVLFLWSIFLWCVFCNKTAASVSTVFSSTTSANDNTSEDIATVEGIQLKYDAPDDCKWWIRADSGTHTTDEEVALACNLRTINSEFDTTNFSVIPSEHTTSLKIECNPEILLKSSLNDKSFAHLAKLRELVLDNCKLGKWPAGTLTGLRDLRNLTVQTRNMDWPSVSLALSAESFYPVRQLERLDLSTNNIWSLPENIFCPLTNLVTLNVSENRLLDVSDLGFREKAPPPQPLISSLQPEEFTIIDAEEKPPPPPPSSQQQPPICSLDIRILDASFNHFVLLPANGFSLLKHLQELRVRNNQISTVVDRALAGLKNLKYLDMSNNKIVSLPLDLFLESADSIAEIYLQNNSISVLSPRLFANLNQLLSLDLSFNQLTSAWMNNETFSGLIRLVSLNLSHNRISKLDPTLFHDLYTLQVLNLESNFLESIPANTFTALNNLHTLILSYNKIIKLEAFSLNGLYVLGLLSLDNNKLESLHPESLKNCSEIQDLNLNGNKLNAVPTAIKNMHALRTLDLGENFITNIEKSAFQGLTNLYGLRLIANQLTNLTRKTFDQLPSLQILNLSQNTIKTIEKGTFSSNHKLEAIRLDNNALVSIDGLFDNVRSLVWLNISQNRLTEFDYRHFSGGLTWLDIHGNFIESLTNQKKLNMSLQTLDASFNKLTRVSPTSIPDSVELLFLNDNNIRFIEPHTFKNKTNLTRVDLYANEISTLELTALQLSDDFHQNRSLPDFYIAGNPFHCDCSMEWLQRINKLGIRQYPTIMDLDNVYCKLIYNREKNYVPLLEIPSSQFLCPYKSHCYTLCQCCVFDACDCEMNCPANCVCYHDQSWSSNIVDCSSANYTEMPNKIPMDATEIYLDGNTFGELSSHSFIGRKNLKVLFANNSNVRVIYNNTFGGIGKLAVLHLEYNLIQALSGFEFNSLISLKELYLQNNRISSINNRTFVPLKNLEILRLDNNFIRSFDMWQFISNPYLVQISVSENPWTCYCKFVNEFRLWVRENAAKVADAEAVMCLLGNSSYELGPFLKDATNDSCVSFFGVAAKSEILQDYLPFLLLTSSIFVISVVLVMAIFLYRKELHLCLYSRCGFRSCYKSTGLSSNDSDRERLFDAYVAYCVKDEDFVTQIFCSNLEHCDSPYRLCLHYRDFNVGSYVADTIIEAAESSKRTILVLSRNFLHTEWCRFEYRSALREVLRDKRNKTIFVLFGEIPPKDLDTDLRLYLRTHTCIQWGDNLFWQKLKYALPDTKECLSTFTISRNNHNNSNVYATPITAYHHHNNENGGGRYLTCEYPRIPPPPPQYSVKVNNQTYNTSLRNGTSHSSLPKHINLEPWS